MTEPSKLTLRLDSGLIENAKAFAHANERSLSQLVADYFARLGVQSTATTSSKGAALKKKAGVRGEAVAVSKSTELSAVTSSLRGALKAKSIPNKASKKTRETNPDRAAYRKSLEEKYL